MRTFVTAIGLILAAAGLERLGLAEPAPLPISESIIRSPFDYPNQIRAAVSSATSGSPAMWRRAGCTNW